MSVILSYLRRQAEVQGYLICWHKARTAAIWVKKANSVLLVNALFFYGGMLLPMTPIWRYEIDEVAIIRSVLRQYCF